MGTDEMLAIVELIDRVVSDIENDATIEQVKSEVQSLCNSFPLYRELHD